MKNITGQIDLFEVMEQMKEPNFPKGIAEHLKDYCQEWDYKWIEQLQEKKTHERFQRLFCNVTRIYFAHINGKSYHVEFGKDGYVIIKRCGPDFDQRKEDAVIRIEEVLKEL